MKPKKKTTEQMIEEMESLIELDENSLDRECVNQAKVFLYFATQLADARLNAAEAKANLELVGAELAQSIRASPSRFGLAKVTETVVEEVKLTQPLYQEAVKRLNLKKHKVDLLQSMVDAMDHRKRMIEGSIQLRGQGYFAEPKAKGEAGKEAVKSSIRNRGRMEK